MKQSIMVTLIGEPEKNWKLPVIPGSYVKLVKETANNADTEAIAVYTTNGKQGCIIELNNTVNLDRMIGYVANSVHTKANGTYSAGRLYDLIKDEVIAQVRFVHERCCIAELEI